MGSASPDIVDVLIVGGGPSGLATALTLSRALHTTAIFDSGSYRNGDVGYMHLTPTWDHGDPAKYREEARKELTARYKTNTLVDEKVVSVKKSGDGKFILVDGSGKEWIGRKLVLAVGVKDVYPNIEGYAECWPNGIFHCLYCHGYEERGAKSVGVLAVDLFSMVMPMVDGATRNALQFTDSVTIYTNGSEEVAEKVKPLLAKKKAVKYDTRPIQKLVKEKTDAQVTIHFKDGTSVTEGFLVHSPKMSIDLDFAKDLNLERSPSGMELKLTFPFNETTEPGCFAAGDITSFAKVVTNGVTSGGFAANGAVRQLQGDD